MAESLILLFKVDGASKKKDVSAFEINTEAAWVKREQRFVFQCNIFNSFYMINLLSDLIGFTEPKDKCGPTTSELQVSSSSNSTRGGCHRSLGSHVGSWPCSFLLGADLLASVMFLPRYKGFLDQK